MVTGSPKDGAKIDFISIEDGHIIFYAGDKQIRLNPKNTEDAVDMFINVGFADPCMCSSSVDFPEEHGLAGFVYDKWQAFIFKKVSEKLEAYVSMFSPSDQVVYGVFVSGSGGMIEVYRDHVEACRHRDYLIGLKNGYDYFVQESVIKNNFER